MFVIRDELKQMSLLDKLYLNILQKIQWFSRPIVSSLQSKKEKERNHNTDNSELWVKYLSWISAKERARKKQLENRLLRRKQSHLKLSGSPVVSSWISAKKQRGRNSETKIERERNQEHRCNKTVRHIWSSLLNIYSWISFEISPVEYQPKKERKQWDTFEAFCDQTNHSCLWTLFKLSVFTNITLILHYTLDIQNVSELTPIFCLKNILMCPPIKTAQMKFSFCI